MLESLKTNLRMQPGTFLRPTLAETPGAPGLPFNEIPSGFLSHLRPTTYLGSECPVEGDSPVHREQLVDR